MERDKSMKQKFGLIAVEGETDRLLIRDSVFLECEAHLPQSVLRKMYIKP